MTVVQVLSGLWQVPDAWRSKCSILPQTSRVQQWSMESSKTSSCLTSRENILSSSSTLWTCEYVSELVGCSFCRLAPFLIILNTKSSSLLTLFFRTFEVMMQFFVFFFSDEYGKPYITLVTVWTHCLASVTLKGSQSSLVIWPSRGHEGPFSRILFQSFLKEAFVSSFGMGRDVQSLMLYIQHFLCQPQRCPHSNAP